MTLNTDIPEKLQKWISTLQNPVEPKVTEWLKKNLGDQYSDDIDIIIVGAKGEDTVIGKYQIKFFPEYLDGIQVCSSNSFKSMLPYQFIIDDTSNAPLTDAQRKDVEKWYTDTMPMYHNDFQKEYKCNFKSDIEIIHYDDFHHRVSKAQIGLAEFGNDRGYIVDCVIMNFRNGDPRVSYYANLSDFTGHPKWDHKNCFVVCFDERYKQDHKSETK